MVARAGKAAHTAYNVVTRDVFHAPMFALNAISPANACEPSNKRSTPTEGARMCRVYMYMFMMCLLAIYPGGRTHARTCDGNGRIAHV